MRIPGHHGRNNWHLDLVKHPATPGTYAGYIRVFGPHVFEDEPPFYAAVGQVFGHDDPLTDFCVGTGGTPGEALTELCETLATEQYGIHDDTP